MLHKCVLNFGPNDFQLPALTHLKLRDVEVSSRQSHWRVFLNPACSASLTDLVLVENEGQGAHEASRTKALVGLAPQLVRLELDDELLWVGTDDSDV